MTRLITLVIVIGMLLAPGVTASAVERFPTYQGSEWTDVAYSCPDC